MVSHERKLTLLVRKIEAARRCLEELKAREDLEQDEALREAARQLHHWQQQFHLAAAVKAAEDFNRGRQLLGAHLRERKQRAAALHLADLRNIAAVFPGLFDRDLAQAQSDFDQRFRRVLKGAR